MSDATEEDVSRFQLRVDNPRISFRDDDLIQIRPHSQEASATVRGWLGQLSQDIGAGSHLSEDAHGEDAGGCAALVWRAQRDQRVHSMVTAHALDVVAAYEAAHGMPDDVHSLIPGFSGDCLDCFGQLGGDCANIGAEPGVVERDNTAESSLAQSTAKQSKDAAVVDNSVNQDDRRAGGFHITDEQSTLDWWQPFKIMAFHLFSNLLFSDTEWVHRDVGG